MANLRIWEPACEPDSEAPFFSHQSYDHEVYAVCHHSGRYLTRGETNPSPRAFLREQHDFPGLPKLDRSFARAAHSAEHQHLTWSRVAIQAMGLALSAALIVALMVEVWRYEAFVAAGWQQTGFTALLILLAAAAASLLGWSLNLLARRDELFHARAAGMPPAIADYPLACTYEVDAWEKITTVLGNATRAAPEAPKQDCAIQVTLHPKTDDLESYPEYTARYRDLGAGDHIHAGVLALAGVDAVRFAEPGIEYNHRLILRSAATGFPLADDGRTLAPFTVQMRYTVEPDKLSVETGGSRVLLLECRPMLSAADSRTLTLRFEWRGTEELPDSWLHECVLMIPPQLGRATRVGMGRYDPLLNQVSWCNLPFSERVLDLQVSFEQPILECGDLFTGRYDVRLDGLISGLKIVPEHLWTAWGLPAEVADAVFRRQTTFTGELKLDARRLTQQHETVRALTMLGDAAPDRRLVEQIAMLLLGLNIELRRIAEAAPRLDPIGELDTALRYWDILGRCYNPERLDAFDVHVVVRGHESAASASRTEVEVRVRGLHDPRDQTTRTSIHALVDSEDESGTRLAEQISRAIASLHPA